MFRVLIFAMAISGLSLGGCSQSKVSHPLVSMPLTQRQAPDMKQTAYRAADAMILAINGKLRQREKILPASFVDEKGMESSSALGRLLSRQVAARFTQAGYEVVEIKLRKNILLQKGSGQFLLSQELEKLRDTHKAHAVLTGSYVVAKNRIYANTQLVRLKDGVTLAAEDFNLPLTPDIKRLLAE